MIKNTKRKKMSAQETSMNSYHVKGRLEIESRSDTDGGSRSHVPFANTENTDQNYLCYKHIQKGLSITIRKKTTMTGEKKPYKIWNI